VREKQLKKVDVDTQAPFLIKREKRDESKEALNSPLKYKSRCAIPSVGAF
jgi:hypothetical protein